MSTTQHLTPEDAIRARLEAARTGVYVNAGWSDDTQHAAVVRRNDARVVATISDDAERAFVAHAPEDIEYLLDRVEDLSAGVQALAALAGPTASGPQAQAIAALLEDLGLDPMGDERA